MFSKVSRSPIGLLVAAVVLLLFSGCSKDYQVKVEVTGTAKEAMISYGFDGAINQTVSALPWSTSRALPSSSIISANAQNQSEAGDIAISIIVDNQVMESGSATSAYGVAQAAVALPAPDYLTPGIILGLLLALGGGAGVTKVNPAKDEPSGLQSPTPSPDAESEGQSVLVKQIDPFSGLSQQNKNLVAGGLFGLILLLVIYTASQM